MADLVPTVGDVLRVSGNTEAGIAGETITAGQVVYKAAADSTFNLADADATTVTSDAELDNVYGIALNGAAVSQPVVVQTTGVIDIGCATLIGDIYILSDTAGGIMPVADVIATNYVTIIGIGNTITNITLDIKVSGVQYTT